MESDSVYTDLESKVIMENLCTHCGTCVGLSNGLLEMRQTDTGPLPIAVTSAQVVLDSQALDTCPGKGINYPVINEYLFKRQPDNWLLGCYKSIFVGFSNTPDIRQRGASGGVITQTLLYLLRQGTVDGVVVLRQGFPEPWSNVPIIAQTEAEIIAASQSVYTPTSMNVILNEIEDYPGSLGYVGLPDQVASIRALQRLGHPGALKIEYILGLYMGTGIYMGAIETFLRMNRIHGLDDVDELRYRDGEWPGYLRIRTKSGRILRAEKFYYNYLIPFYITKTSLLSVDFTNELSDLSFGDAWNPRYEKIGGGFSVVISRTSKGEELLRDMQRDEAIVIEQIDAQDAISMHGHMLDFKKRGAFIRIRWLKALGRQAPDYGYQPDRIPVIRKLVELVIIGIFLICRSGFARRLVEFVPLWILGPVFDSLRRLWKRLSKPLKRQGMSKWIYQVTNSTKS